MKFNRDYTPRPKPEKKLPKVPRPLARSPLKKKIRKPTGELLVFEMIWAERPHVCQVTGDPILKFDPWCFMHVLSKGAFPKFRLLKENILLVTRATHIEYDNGDRSHEMFDEVNKLSEYLKFKYYGNENR